MLPGLAVDLVIENVDYMKKLKSLGGMLSQVPRATMTVFLEETLGFHEGFSFYVEVSATIFHCNFGAPRRRQEHVMRCS